jgi:hypothetical protein
MRIPLGLRREPKGLKTQKDKGDGFGLIQEKSPPPSALEQLRGSDMIIRSHNKGTKWRRWFALFPVEIAKRSDGDGYEWLWLDWYEYRRPKQFTIERRYEDLPPVTFSTCSGD